MLPFGLSWTESVVIFLLALALFGPKKLPELGRTVSKAIGEFRRASSELKYTWDQQMRELEKDTAEVRSISNEAENEIQSYNYDSSYDYDGQDPYYNQQEEPKALEAGSEDAEVANDSSLTNPSLEGDSAVLDTPSSPSTVSEETPSQAKGHAA